MRVLVTGSEGRVGRHLVPALAALGHEATRFDLVLGHDVRSRRQVRRAVAPVDAVVHLATVRYDARWPAALATNVWGLRTVLAATRAAGVHRLVNLSSLQVTGLLMGHRPPVRFPIDESHPCAPRTPYEVTKHLGERLCRRAASRDPDLRAVSLRPPAVWDGERYDRDRARWAADETRQWRPFWEYGAFLDVADLTTLVHLALVTPLPAGHQALNAAAPDCAARWPTLDLVERLHPGVPWRRPEDRAAFEHRPHGSLVDSARAEALLGWRATRCFHPSTPEP